MYSSGFTPDRYRKPPTLSSRIGFIKFVCRNLRAIYEFVQKQPTPSANKHFHLKLLFVVLMRSKLMETGKQIEYLYTRFNVYFVFIDVQRKF